MAKLRAVRKTSGCRLSPGSAEFKRAAKTVGRPKLISPRPSAPAKPARKPPPPFLPKSERQPVTRSVEDIADRLEKKDKRDAKEAKGTRELRSRLRKEDRAREDALEAARTGSTPRSNGHETFGVLTVDEPKERDARGRPIRRQKVISTRDDPIGWMYQHKQLEGENDRDGRDAEMRLASARRFQQLYERAEIGGAKAIDFTKDVVDGGQIATPDAMLRKEAHDALNALWLMLGKNGSNLVRRVLGEKRTLVEVAAMLLGIDVPTDRVERSMLIRGLVGNLLDALDSLADHFGIRPKRGARGPRRASDKFDDLAPSASENQKLARALWRARTEQ